jgi:hypothetical protein
MDTLIEQIQVLERELMATKHALGTERARVAASGEALQAGAS